MRMSTLSNNLLFLVGRKKKVLRFPAKKILHSIICGRLYGFETHCAHLLYLYVGDDSNFGMFRSTLDYYSRLVITNILPTFFSFPAQVCDVQIQRNATNFLISLTHSEWAIFIPPHLSLKYHPLPYPKTQMPQTHTDT